MKTTLLVVDAQANMFDDLRATDVIQAANEKFKKFASCKKTGEISFQEATRIFCSALATRCFFYSIAAYS